MRPMLDLGEVCSSQLMGGMFKCTLTLYFLRGERIACVSFMVYFQIFKKLLNLAFYSEILNCHIILQFNTTLKNVFNIIFLLKEADFSTLFMDAKKY